MKLTLKAPGAKRLKLKYDEPLSNFAFNFNLRRYTVAIFFPLFIIGMMPLRMLLEVGPAGHCSPRHPTPLESSCPELNGIL